MAAALLGWKDDKLLAGEAKAAASLFSPDDITGDIEWVASLGITSYMLTCPETLPTPVVEGAVEVANENGVELLQLTGPNLTTGLQPEHAAFQLVAAQAASQQAVDAGDRAASSGDDASSASAT